MAIGGEGGGSSGERKSTTRYTSNIRGGREGHFYQDQSQKGRADGKTKREGEKKDSFGTPRKGKSIITAEGEGRISPLKRGVIGLR